MYPKINWNYINSCGTFLFYKLLRSYQEKANANI